VAEDGAISAGAQAQANSVMSHALGCVNWVPVLPWTYGMVAQPEIGHWHLGSAASDRLHNLLQVPLARQPTHSDHPKLASLRSCAACRSNHCPLGSRAFPPCRLARGPTGVRPPSEARSRLRGRPSWRFGLVADVMLEPQRECEVSSSGRASIRERPTVGHTMTAANAIGAVAICVKTLTAFLFEIWFEISP